MGPRFDRSEHFSKAVRNRHPYLHQLLATRHSALGAFFLLTFFTMSSELQSTPDYGTALLHTLSRDLTRRHGKGFSRSNLIYMRLLYLEYPISQKPSDLLSWSQDSIVVSTFSKP